MLVKRTNLKKKIGKVFTSKFVGTGPSSYKKRICRAAVSQRLRNTVLEWTDAITNEVLRTNYVRSTIPHCTSIQRSRVCLSSRLSRESRHRESAPRNAVQSLAFLPSIKWNI